MPAMTPRMIVCPVGTPASPMGLYRHIGDPDEGKEQKIQGYGQDQIVEIGWAEFTGKTKNAHY